MSGSRSKKSGKKNKFLKLPEVLEVKSVKLETNRPSSRDGRPNSKSEDSLRKARRSTILKNLRERGEDESLSHEGDVAELETRLMKKFKTLSLSNGGENSVASTSTLNTETQNKVVGTSEDELPLVMEYCPEVSEEAIGTADVYTYKYYTKHTKSIKFTNQVTVLYFNGEDIISESLEPLKKELDQQLRNKEMRKEHLMTKGQFDNLYLF